MRRYSKPVAAIVIIAVLVLFPWSGQSDQCSLGVPGSNGGCVTEFMSPLGLRYPEWLGVLFYVILLAAIGWVLLIPFKRLDRRSETQDDMP